MPVTPWGSGLGAWFSQALPPLLLFSLPGLWGFGVWCPPLLLLRIPPTCTLALVTIRVTVRVTGLVTVLVTGPTACLFVSLVPV